MRLLVVCPMTASATTGLPVFNVSRKYVRCVRLIGAGPLGSLVAR